ncbi:hypothetical protein [Xylanimonas protaetiae]|uniref:Uncharacterized protein n=1 Tax=Xylanimonas protaetiae TaxID=2509457 RepID=A0A4P6F1U7_9MICO|nr:hypothetical protein [Xylanimonas protaetiae]QAY69482.1 hypothetical protein ET471_05040 [Xylanimonas protaetiae]
MTATARQRRSIGALTAVLAVGLVVVGALMLGGVLPRGSAPARPVCVDLPTSAQVRAALTAHPDLLTDITGQGPGIVVRAASPGCHGNDEYLIDITYTTQDERRRIENVINHHDGFGVPLNVHR